MSFMWMRSMYLTPVEVVAAGIQGAEVDEDLEVDLADKLVS